MKKAKKIDSDKKNIRPSHISKTLWENLPIDLRDNYKNGGYGKILLNEKDEFTEAVYIPPSCDND